MCWSPRVLPLRPHAHRTPDRPRPALSRSGARRKTRCSQDADGGAAIDMVAFVELEITGLPWWSCSPQIVRGDRLVLRPHPTSSRGRLVGLDLRRRAPCFEQSVVIGPAARGSSGGGIACRREGAGRVSARELELDVGVDVVLCPGCTGVPLGARSRSSRWCGSSSVSSARLTGCPAAASLVRRVRRRRKGSCRWRCGLMPSFDRQHVDRYVVAARPRRTPAVTIGQLADRGESAL